MGKVRPRNIDFGDDETRLITIDLVADLLCIIRETCTELTRIRLWATPLASADRARSLMHFLSEGVMQQNPRGRDTLDQLRDGPKPGLPNNFREQTCLR